MGIRTNAPKKGNYATVSHTEFELNSVGNDWVRVDYGPGAMKIGSKIACHFKTNNKIIEIERQLCTLYPAQACKHSNTMPAQQHRTSYIWWLYVSHIMYHLYRMQKGGGGGGGTGDNQFSQIQHNGLFIHNDSSGSAAWILLVQLYYYGVQSDKLFAGRPDVC